ncbi:helix-turn-helix transcriptional regulator [Pseudomonas sihuiensis]|uniref:Prophage CP4-57 regulatory protein (AlpA) n=2 Tax=Pseudomonadaceae TaxID=135621 RepID=A0A1H2M2V2_9PSED|nr:AlpA family phage regulatory protein [Pseudomonas sihuiensis]SDU87211.1 Prophage CP4-57 regulatory protein (AlpA) [Pseudomonas sihuiensis]
MSPVQKFNWQVTHRLKHAYQNRTATRHGSSCAVSTINEMERRGEFPRRFNLTPHCVVWDLAEVEAWIEERKRAPRINISKPDVYLTKTRPVRAG